MNKTNVSAIVCCCLILQECISVEYIEDRKRILSNIKTVEESKDLLPKELSEEVDRFIENTIEPLLNPKYLYFIDKPKYGYKKADSFVIDSEKSLNMFMGDFFEHLLKLNIELLKIFSKYIR